VYIKEPNRQAPFYFFSNSSYVLRHSFILTLSSPQAKGVAVHFLSTAKGTEAWFYSKSPSNTNLPIKPNARKMKTRSLPGRPVYKFD